MDRRWLAFIARELEWARGLTPARLREIVAMAKRHMPPEDLAATPAPGSGITVQDPISVTVPTPQQLGAAVEKAIDRNWDSIRRLRG